jgi:aspartate/methionine/tyrosine aminotransferase
MFYKELAKVDLPIKPLACESGYFFMVDISACADLIPDRFKSSHDFEEGLAPGENGVTKNRYFMDDGRLPLDLAFCRWIAVTRGVVMMPCSLFYHKSSAIREDRYVRLAICKGYETSFKAMQKLLRLI